MLAGITPVKYGCAIKCGYFSESGCPHTLVVAAKNISHPIMKHLLRAIYLLFFAGILSQVQLCAFIGVQHTQLLADGVGGIADNTISKYLKFGTSVAPLGDFDGDGVEDIVVGYTGESFINGVESIYTTVGGVSILLL